MRSDGVGRLCGTGLWHRHRASGQPAEEGGGPGAAVQAPAAGHAARGDRHCRQGLHRNQRPILRAACGEHPPPGPSGLSFVLCFTCAWRGTRVCAHAGPRAYPPMDLTLAQVQLGSRIHHREPTEHDIIQPNVFRSTNQENTLNPRWEEGEACRVSHKICASLPPHGFQPRQAGRQAGGRGPG